MDQKTETKRSPVLMPARFGLVEQLRNDWIANAETGTTLEDIVQPEYWAHNSARMRPYDHIEVRAEDGSWMAELLVTGCDRNWARVKLLQEYKLTSADVSLSQAVKHEIQWKGPHLKFAVIRLSDKESVKTGFDDKNSAARWLIEHEKTAA